MKALSIRQPWAWLIIRPDITDQKKRVDSAVSFEIKDIENRSWATSFRGRVLVHASNGMTRSEYREAIDPLCLSQGNFIELPPFDDLQRGGIIGSVEIVDCVSSSGSPWFYGPFGFVLRDPQPLPFIPFKGALGFFNVPDEIIQHAQQVAA